MMAAMNVNAQNGEDYLKHEIGISYGVFSNSTWMSIGDDMGSAIASVGAFTYDDSKFIGPIGLEYFYHISPVVGLGAIGVYANETKDMLLRNNKYGEAKNTYITVMPAAKFNWLRKKYFGLYSKVAAGVCFRSQKEDYRVTDNPPHHDSKNKVLFNFHVTGIGLEAGSPYLRGFLECGVGEQGIFAAGVRAKF